jgi:hypothetical protein
VVKGHNRNPRHRLRPFPAAPLVARAAGTWSWCPGSCLVMHRRYMIVVPRPMPAAPHRYLIVAPRLLPTAPLVVRRRDLIVVPRPMPTAPRRYLIVVHRPLPEAPLVVRRKYLIVASRPLAAAPRRDEEHSLDVQRSRVNIPCFICKEVGLPSRRCTFGDLSRCP